MSNMVMNKAYLVKRIEGNVLGEAQSFLITPEKVLLGPNGNVISVINQDNLEEKVNKTDINFKGSPSKLKKLLVNGEKYRVKVYQDKNGIVQVVPYDNKFSQWGKQGIATISLLASMLLFYACPNTSRPNGNDNGPTPYYGDLSGTVKGLIKKGLINDVTVSLPNTDYSAKTDANGNFEIKGIENPSNYKRIRLRSNNIIDRETNISLGIGENVADIDVIEGDNISGFYYDDYLTVNDRGLKIDPNRNYKVYFYNESVFEWNGSKFVFVKKITPDYTDDALEKIKDVLQNDLTAMSGNMYKYNGVLLESEGAEGPGNPGELVEKKDGWLVIYLSKDQGMPMYTAKFPDDKNLISGASLSINYYAPKKPIGRRGAYSQDIGEWAGFVDILKKYNYSIFADDDHGYKVPNYPSDFDLNYIAVIKKNRLPGHGSSGNIPDYDPVGSTSGIHIVNYIPTSPGANQGFKSGFKTPFDEPNSTKQYRKDYRRWLIREGILPNKGIDERKLRKNVERDIK